MGRTKVLMTVGVVLAAITVYHLYIPTPPELEQPLTYKFVAAGFKVIDDIGHVCEALGIKERRFVHRDTLAYIQQTLRPDLTNDPEVAVTDEVFDGVRVRVYRPRDSGSDQSRDALVYVHGGGFLLCIVEGYDGALAQIVRRTKIVILSIDYGLAPEHPSPTAMEDCERATRYLFSHAEDWGVNPSRIGIAGDSAGGNMAGVLSLKFRDQGGVPQFLYQILIYPWLQSMDFQLPSYLINDPYQFALMRQKHMAVFTLNYFDFKLSNIDKVVANMHVTKETRQKYEKYFDVSRLPERFRHIPEDLVPKDAGVDEELAKLMEPKLVDPYNFPLMAESVADVPQALVITVGSDVLRDEGLLYLARLREEDVDTEHYHDDTCWHGAVGFIEEPLKFNCGVRIMSRIIEYIGSRPT